MEATAWLLLIEVHELSRKKDMKDVQVNEERSICELEVINKEAIAKVSVIVKPITATKDTIPVFTGTMQRDLDGTTPSIRISCKIPIN